MEVLNQNGGILSNYEVLRLMQEVKQESTKGSVKNQSLATICYETIKYLEQTPCKHQSKDFIATFIKSVERFKPTKAEKLQLLNLQPTAPVEIQLIIEESEERLTEEQVDELLDGIAQLQPNSESESKQT